MANNTAAGYPWYSAEEGERGEGCFARKGIPVLIALMIDRFDLSIDTM